MPQIPTNVKRHNKKSNSVQQDWPVCEISITKFGCRPIEKFCTRRQPDCPSQYFGASPMIRSPAPSRQPVTQHFVPKLSLSLSRVRRGPLPLSQLSKQLSNSCWLFPVLPVGWIIACSLSVCERMTFARYVSNTKSLEKKKKNQTLPGPWHVPLFHNFFLIPCVHWFPNRRSLSRKEFNGCDRCCDDSSTIVRGLCL